MKTFITMMEKNKTGIYQKHKQQQTIGDHLNSSRVSKNKSNLDVFIQSAGRSCIVRCGIESGVAPRVDRHSEDRYRSQSVTIQRCSADIGWGQGGSCAAHCHPYSSAALCRAWPGLRAHCEVWEIRHGCCRLYWCHCCCGPVLTVTCSCKFNIWKLKV